MKTLSFVPKNQYSKYIYVYLELEIKYLLSKIKNR